MMLLKSPPVNKVQNISVKNILDNPYTKRAYYNASDFSALCASVKENGVIKPLTVKPLNNGKYCCISGERRLHAAKKVGLATVPCILNLLSEQDMILYALMESITDCTLNYFEIGVLIQKLHEEFSLSYLNIANKLGISLPAVYSYLNYLSFTAEQRRKMIENGVTKRHAESLLQLQEPDRDVMLNEVIEQRFNLSQTQKRCKEALYKGARNRKPISFFKDVAIFINTVDKAVKTMQDSGIKAECSKTDLENGVEFRILIPK